MLLYLVYAETTIQCTCRQGYIGNGIGINGCIKNNRTVIEPCMNNPCGSHGECLSSSNNSFLCLCDTGYTGTIWLIKIKILIVITNYYKYNNFEIN